ncbi:hypothetical protein BT96DRAFT_988037 [Gymnopus androsaceus JB14]|uniref:Uncharacterized protein n=1 Tax=Gymnopus androsaceus JB14 TaxID=1447944 RepID=A0A6A4I7E8_9AGAR|nr:hypothetical protein BT96DRAFT_988037 [Gymnopus androsaceus JB14]
MESTETDRWNPLSLDLESTFEPYCRVASHLRFTSQFRPSISKLSSPFHRNPPPFSASSTSPVEFTVAIESPSFTVASFPTKAHDYILQQQTLNTNIPSRLSGFTDSPGRLKSYSSPLSSSSSIHSLFCLVNLRAIEEMILGGHLSTL